MAWDNKILHNVNGVRRFELLPDSETGVKWEADTGIGVLSGSIYSVHVFRHGVVGVDSAARIQEGVTLCDDPQIVATFMSGLSWEPKDYGLWDRSDGKEPVLDIEGFKPGEIPVLSKKEAFEYLIAHNVPSPGTPI